MKNALLMSLAVLAVAGTSGCAPRYYGYRHHGYGQEYGVHAHHGDARYDDAWDLVRSDPCLYDQYRRFAAEHENPNKRRKFIERLARDGCGERERARYYY